ncbi:hypothetical protein AYK26_06675 [Euryarchaeota archaeon SM23-78]|nr:MAG: hypothetical protein AYK26_06675 [Euryarchaeota archaeon SM23-78]MBW3001379.1 Lrp/AsnC family transcriptional regulator [Candidatus Woesearchaeota archaeon]
MRVLEQFEKEKRIKLDLKDKKILSILAKNARTPATVIAKEVGLSRDAVSYRIKNYMKNKVLQGYRVLIDPDKLGYQSYHLFIQVDPPSKEKEKELIEKFKSYPFTKAVLKFSGKYDYEFAIIARDIYELDKYLRRITSDCGEYLQDYEVVLMITEFYIEKSFPKSFLKIKEEDEMPVKKEKEKINLDKKDLAILRVMANNAELPLYAVANRIRLSADAVKYRLKKMMNNGVIKKFIPVVNFATLGYSVYAVLINIRGLTEKKEAKLRQVLNMDKNILWAVKTIGRFNVLTYVCVSNTDELHQTLLNIRSQFPGEVNDYETLIAYQSYKYTYLPEGIEI